MTTSGSLSAYARALFELASVAGAVDAADEGLAVISGAVSNNVDLREALSDLSIPGHKKREIMTELFSGVFSPEAVAIVTLVIEREGASVIGEVHSLYREISESERGIVVAEVITAVALTDPVRESLRAHLASVIGRPVSLRERVDETILGGIRINVAGRVLDGTLVSQLEAMRKTLSKSPQGGEA